MGRKPSNPRPKKAPCQAYQLEWRTFQVYHEAVQAFRKIQQKQIGTCRAWAEKMSNLPQYEKRKLTTKQKSRILLKPSVRPVTCRNEEFFKSFLSYPIPAFPSSSSFVSISTRQLPTKGSSKLSPLALYTVPSQLHIKNVLQ